MNMIWCVMFRGRGCAKTRMMLSWGCCQLLSSFARAKNTCLSPGRSFFDVTRGKKPFTRLREQLNLAVLMFVRKAASQLETLVALRVNAKITAAAFALFTKLLMITKLMPQ